MNNNSLDNTKTSNTIEVYVYDESPDGRPILKSKSVYDVSVTKYITSSYESIQSDSEDYLQCDEDTAEKSSSAEISTNKNINDELQDAFTHNEKNNINPITSYSMEPLIIKSKDIKEEPNIEDEECGNCSCMGQNDDFCCVIL